MNKILIELSVPYIEENYNVFIPVNKKVGTIKKYILQSIAEMTDNHIFEETIFNLYDGESGIKYTNNVYVKDSGIKNGSKLILL